MGNNQFSESPESPEQEPSAQYRVGYKRPPLHSRFKKGHSGNPKGRPRGRRNLRTEFLAEMNQKIEIREGGRVVTVTKRRAIAKSLVNQTIKGNIRATTITVGLDERFSREFEGDGGGEQVVSADDQQILEILDEMAIARKALLADRKPNGGNRS